MAIHAFQQKRQYAFCCVDYAAVETLLLPASATALL
jgi:hypothetical protein